MANILSAAATPFKSSSQPNEERTVGFEAALLAFSSMTIYGLASCEGKQVPFVLHRSTSFPSRRTTTVCKVTCDEIEGWDSMPLPVEKPHLELELGESLGDGRIGFVYVARVVAVLDRPDGAPVSNLPLELSTELVVKFVRPTNCRSLARETWFYEHLPEAEGFQGAVVPLCYGFFTASTTSVQPRKPASLEIKPWIGPYGEHVPLDFSEGQRKYGDELPDEYPCGMYSDDARTCRTESPWCEWRPDPENPLLGVLVLEKLGETYSCDVYDTDQKSRKDVADLIDDLSAAGIKHHDFKCNNVARALAHVVCPRHGYAHGWRIIVFDRSERWGKTMAFDEEYFLPINRMEYIEDNYNDFPGSFWTSIAY